MARTFIQPGGTVTLTLPHDIKSGDVAMKGTFVGVAEYSAKAGEEVEVRLWGVHNLPKGESAFTQGDLAYWDGSQVAAAGGTLLGIVMLDTDASASEVRVLLSGSTGA